MLNAKMLLMNSRKINLTVLRFIGKFFDGERNFFVVLLGMSFTEKQEENYKAGLRMDWKELNSLFMNEKKSSHEIQFFYFLLITIVELY